MKEILIYSGTTEGRKLAELLCSKEIPVTVCVATQYGETVMEKRPGLTIHQGRMSVEEMRRLTEEGDFLAVIDATHPFATVVSEHIRESLKDTKTRYLRLKRDTAYAKGREEIQCFKDHAACVEALSKTEGNILLTTGSKELSVYTKADLSPRLYVRVLPAAESIALCQQHGITGKQIIAMQGPFSVKLNEAMIDEYEIRWLVTKESGESGGFMEKIAAAKNRGIKTMVIQNPEQTKGETYEEVRSKLEELTGIPLTQIQRMQISLVGVGMGSTENMTTEAMMRIREADLLFGAQRLLEGMPEDKVKLPFYLAKDILPVLKDKGCGKKSVVLFSGDTGFYSGAQKLAQRLKEEMESGCLEADLTILPGISAVSYLAARLGIGWQDGAIISIHGRSANLPEIVRENPKTFLLLSGVQDLNRLGNQLVNANLKEIRITAGYQLSYPEERIERLTPAECCTICEEGLYICLLEHEGAINRLLTHGRPDEEFIRDKVPMTKEEIREISICKLRLHKEAVLYDIGSGTGSLAVEAAGLSHGIRVYAIERKQEAVSLINRNRKKFGLNNITVIEGEAPLILDELPPPTHALIGGSGGKLKEILVGLYEKNPVMRIVINAITLETMTEVMRLLEQLQVEQTDISQIQVSKAVTAGGYHLMKAHNPVFIVSFQFREVGNPGAG